MNSYQRVLGGLFLAVTVSFFADISVGPVTIEWVNIWAAVVENKASLDALILFDIRLPRAFLAMLVGATLGISGAALQGLLRNPLAESGVIGVSNCAALGAVLVFYFGMTQWSWFVLPLAGLVGALVSVVMIFLLAGRSGSTVTLILAGIAINTLAGALMAMALNFAPNPYAMQEIVFWLLGSVANRSMNEVLITVPFITVGWVLILSCGRFLNALTLGEETTKSLGFNVRRLRWRLVIGVVACVGAAVSVSGNIGFIGLVIPHLLRPWVRHDPQRLLAVSALGGAVLLLLSDVAVQLLSSEGELKLGVITSLVGGPFFLYLILKNRNVWS
jgi:iron complex transport system permease protein